MKQKLAKLARILFILASIGSLYFVPWKIIWVWALPLPTTIEEQLEQGISHGFDGVIVYVDKPGEPPAFYAAGWHDRELKIPAYPDAYFKIASIGKLYHALAITKLVSEDKLSLDQTLSYYFPELVGKIEYADQITLRMLVQHRSGIPNLTDTPNFYVNPPKDSEEALSRIFHLPADFVPDTDYAYSNTNYLLLSELIGKTSTAGKFEYFKKAILDPLERKHTFVSKEQIAIDSLMGGYYVGIEENIKTANYGSMIATAQDVGVFLRALNEGTIFGPGEKEIYDQIYVYEHTGLLPGYMSIAKYHADIDAVVIQFINTTNFSGYEWSISEIVYNRILKILRKDT
jgi:CubicO group peptidase (beta-lactamase class C family)